jgi:hypothetical protein
MVKVEDESLDSEGLVRTHEISQQLGIPLSTVQRRRKRLEEDYLLRHYSLDPMKFGYRKIDLLIYTEGGGTIEIGKELVKREEVTYAARTIGEHTIDLRNDPNGVLYSESGPANVLADSCLVLGSSFDYLNAQAVANGVHGAVLSMCDFPAGSVTDFLVN